MSREIKFRAWFKGDENNNPGWIQGFNLVNFHDYFTKGIEPMLQRYDKTWGKDQYVLMQFTGLKDNNGKEIYEGDIVSLPMYYETPEMSSNPTVNWQVIFDNSRFALVNKEHPADDPEQHLGYVMFQYDGNIEVIGNIHQNPELLNK